MADTIQDRLKGGIDVTADKAKTAVDATARAANGAKQEGQGLIDRVKANAGGLVDRAGDVVTHAREKVEEWAGEGQEVMQHAGEKAQKWASEACDVASNSISDFGKEVTTLIRKHPLPALAVGFGLGLLIGRTARII